MKRKKKWNKERTEKVNRILCDYVWFNRKWKKQKEMEKKEEKKRNGNSIFVWFKDKLKRKHKTTNNKLKKLRKKNFFPNSFHSLSII